MNEYELMTVFHPRLGAEETAAAIAALQEQVVANGGEVLSTDDWGRRRLAYPIDGVPDGNYVLMTFNLPAPGTVPLERWLRLSETTLRHLLIRGIIPFEGDRHGREDRSRDDRDRDDRDDRDDQDDWDERGRGDGGRDDARDDGARDDASASEAPAAAADADAESEAEPEA